MKRILLITGLCGASVVYAEPKPLPPIINNSSYASGMPYSGNTASKPMLEMLGRVDILQAEIQELRGLVEQQANEISKLQKRQQNSYIDIDTRLQQLEGGGETHVAKETGIVSQATKSGPKSQAKEKAAFDKAFRSVRSSDYQRSVTLLKQLIQDYPGGEYSDNATFWLASVYKVTNDLPAAKRNFQAVYTHFPESDKAGLAMLKLADIYLEENSRQKAVQLYTQVTTQYADTSAAHMATQKLQSIGQ
ncbi:MAG: tetratricopeptide repeat protein [Methyloprofundus sp.]|nr:tetratricopeptide repeat protein [Methyloprofundus sp.]